MILLLLGVMEHLLWWERRLVPATVKKEVNPFITAIHCIAYRINLVALQAVSTKPCDVMSSKVDDLLNSLVAHFKKSSKRKSCLLKLQERIV